MTPVNTTFGPFDEFCKSCADPEAYPNNGESTPPADSIQENMTHAYLWSKLAAEVPQCSDMYSSVKPSKFCNLNS